MREKKDGLCNLIKGQTVHQYMELIYWKVPTYYNIYLYIDISFEPKSIYAFNDKESMEAF